ncbi:MAG: hypothetical protein M1308_17115 [Actinobacteria bacterium]|nr:hypothetical protein [Actinomycetota bacterium]
MKKNYNKYTSIGDRFPYIIFALIIISAVIFILLFKARYPLPFFSGGSAKTDTTSVSYSIFISSPSNDQIFDLVSSSETVPIVIKSKDIESLDYKLKLIVNGKDEIKTFSSPPYEYNWNPEKSGDYEIVANLVDDKDNIISSSNKIKFAVKYENESTDTTSRSIDIEKKKQEALDGSQYRTQNGAPVFAFKAYTAPIIDGSINEWGIFDEASISNPTIKKENFTNLKDCSGIYYTSWDDANFYLAVQVTDDVFNQSFTGNQINKGDSLSIVFDTDLAGDFSIPFYSGDDLQIDLSPGNFAGIPAEAYIYYPSEVPKGVEVASTKLAKGYIIEAAIPWSNFVSYGPKDIDVMGFTISIFDTDNLGSTELVVSSSKQFEINNVTMLGTLVLIDGGDLQAQTTEGSGTTDTTSGTTATN